MAREVRNEFSTSRQFVASRPLKFGGRLFKPGQEFPWRRIACDQKKLRQLWSQRKLECLAEGETVEEYVLEDLPVEGSEGTETEGSETEGSEGTETEESEGTETEGSETEESEGTETEGSETEGSEGTETEESEVEETEGSETEESREEIFNPKDDKVRHLGGGRWAVIRKEGDDVVISAEVAQFLRGLDTDGPVSFFVS